MGFGRGIWLLFSFLLFVCFLAVYEHNEFLLLTTLTMFVGSSLGELSVVCFCLLVLLWVSFQWCASVVQWFWLDVNQGGS
jgi:hypothetical protein